MLKGETNFTSFQLQSLFWGLSLQTHICSHSKRGGASFLSKNWVGPYFFLYKSWPGKVEVRVSHGQRLIWDSEYPGVTSSPITDVSSTRTQCCYWEKEELHKLDPNPQTASVFYQMTTSLNYLANVSCFLLQFWAPSKFLQSFIVSRISCNRCYQRHCLENVGWPSTIAVCSRTLGGDFGALQEQERHKWLAS